MTTSPPPDVRRLAWILTALIWVAIGAIVLFWISALAVEPGLLVSFPDELLVIGTAPRSAAPAAVGTRAVPLSVFAAAAAISASAAVALAVSISRLLPVACLWRRGRLFDAAVTGHLVGFARLLMAAAVLGVLRHPANHLLLALTGHGPKRVIVALPPLSFWSLVIVAALIFVITRALRTASELEEDARLTI